MKNYRSMDTLVHTSLHPTEAMCVMGQRFYNIRVAICLSAILVFSLSGQGAAQSPTSPEIDTPSQRWLPPPKAYPNQPNSQAKLLSRLRNLVLNSDQSRDPDPSRLSDADVQSLKEAMKQFGGNLPEGLTADSLDAIPPELISKALSNPELVRQAKELANQFSKTGRPKAATVPSKPNDSPDGEIPQRNRETPESPSEPTVEKGYIPKDQTPRSTNPTEDLDLESRSNTPDFPDLMEKLRNTKRQFEKNQKHSSEVLPPKKSASTSKPPANTNKEKAKSGLPSGSLQPEKDTSAFDSQQNQQRKQSTKGENSTLSNTIRDLATDGNSQPTQNKRSASNGDSKNEGSPGGVSDDGSSKSKSKSASSMDIRKELERSGFGATLQKLVEDAQRSSQSSLANSLPVNGVEPSPPPTKALKPNTDKLGVPDPAKQPPRPANLYRPTENSPKPAKPDSAISKNLKQASKYLNNLWMQVSKSAQIATGTSATPSPSPQENAKSGSFSLPNLFHAKVLECLVVLAVACAIAFLVLRYRVRSEQERREILEAQLAPKIDEIRTRDDVVRAFHAIAKRRLQSAQAWWTCGVVTSRFEDSLPELTGPIRTLSVLYEQARYFPVTHQLSIDQIEDAKVALKQCRG